MNEMLIVLQLATLLTVVIQIFKPNDNIRKLLLVAASAFFIFFSESYVHLLAVFSWLTFVHILCGLVQSKKISSRWALPGYGISVIAVFLAYKIGGVATGDYRVLVEKSVPLGFSFLMFFTLAYVHDIAKGRLPSASLRSFFSAGLFFPILPSGPFFNLQSAFGAEDALGSGPKVLQSYSMIGLGIFKVALSGYIVGPNLMGPLIFNFNPHITSYHPLTVMIGGSLFLYANFSGISDIVVGFGRLMGVNVPVNFRFPFLSYSMADYWRKWHISLGKLFRDYVYFPLSYRLSSPGWAAFVTFLLIGFWHDVNSKFVIYAFVNAGLVAFFMPSQRNAWIGVPITFFLLLVINALFLSKDIPAFLQLISSVYSNNQALEWDRNLVFVVLTVLVGAYLWFCEWLLESLEPETTRWSPVIWGANFIMSALNISMGILLGFSSVEIVYVGF